MKPQDNTPSRPCILTLRYRRFAMASTLYPKATRTNRRRPYTAPKAPPIAAAVALAALALVLVLALVLSA